MLDAEVVHEQTIAFGRWLGESGAVKAVFSRVFKRRDPLLRQSLFGIEFQSPVGIAAGFDYEGKLTQLLPSLDFGFDTIGTFTNKPYGGNPRPRLGRLPKSLSLMVNKGLKNDGVEATLARLRGKPFNCPVGVSIGVTNNPNFKTKDEAIEDVISAFRKAEASGIPFAYYELNISCPNLPETIGFYEPKRLEKLLTAAGKLKLSRPAWIKMPISETDGEIRKMMDVIIKHRFINAVIFGNLVSDRKNPAIRRDEVEKFPDGNFSGVPCRERSNELIRLAFREYGGRMKIIGCGGVFGAEDAFKKIKLGASLVQLITGLVFEGPQLVSQINRGISAILKRDGYSSITQAVGAEA